MNAGLIQTLGTDITEAHEAALAAGHTALEHAHRAGELLMQARAQCEHGAWLSWLAEHCPTIPERTARAYMQIVRRWEELEAAMGDRQRVADLPMREALALFAEPRETPESDEPSDATPDVSALRRELREYERWHAGMRAELSVLERVLSSPDLTIEEATAIVRRADQIVGEAFKRRIHALRDMGRLLLRVRAEHGKKLADLMVSDPEAVRQATEARIAEMEALP